MDVYKAIEKAILKGDLNLLEKIIQKKVREDGTFRHQNCERYSILCLAIKHNRKQLLKYLVLKYKYNVEKNNVLDYAVRLGNMDMVSFMIEQFKIDPYRIEAMLLSAIAKSGSIEMLEHFIQKYNYNLRAHSDTIVQRAAIGGNKEMLEYLIQKYGCDPKPAWPICVGSNNLELIKLLTEKYDCRNFRLKEIDLELMLCSSNLKTLDYIAQYNDISALKNVVLPESISIEDLNHLVVKYEVGNTEKIPVGKIKNAYSQLENDVDRLKFAKTIYEHTQRDALKIFMQKEIDRLSRDIQLQKIHDVDL